MKEYRGNEDGKDIPLNGGSYVDETGDAHEKYNFTPVNMEGREGLYCLGFFETKSHNGKDVNQMRIENIAGCELLKKEESVDDVLVVYCAKHPAHKFTTVVGWYKHATVYRHYQEAVFAPEDIQYYNAIANSSDCVLLPAGIRSRKVQWEVPRKSNGWAYGFGRANVWYASEEDSRLQAFYGIPAVLIAECKSRIDKGLMTDVLDEFDHVLGRSVDTYSDEVDETQANQMIEAAIDQYYIQQDKNGMLLFVEVMVTRMQQAGEVIVPYITENPFMSEEQISKVKAGDTISLDHDVRLKIETVKDADEKEWIGVFTSSEEMHKGSAGNVQMNQSIESILRLALNWEQVNGIVINPFGKYIQMTKKMIELLINGYEYNENERKSKDDENN